MKRTEFIDDVILFSAEDNFPNEVDLGDTDADTYFNPSTLDCEAWQDWYSQDLLNMYFSMVEYDETLGHNYTKHMTFNDFCTFMYANRK